MKYDIFISYRRYGGYETAKHIYDLLVRDHYNVSFDIDTLRSGDFDTQLLTRIEECTDFILIVDPHCFDRTLDNSVELSKDWLRNELSHALKHSKNIIPIFLSGVDGFPNNLPDDIAPVLKKNGLMYNHYYFDAFYDKLKRIYLYSKPQIPAADVSSLTLVRIYPNLDCDIYLFGQHKGRAAKDEFSEIMLPRGENVLKFVSVTDDTVYTECFVEVNEYQRVVKVDFSTILADKRKQIEYTTSDGHKLELNGSYWDSIILDHAYSNGKGVITCKDDVVEIGDNAFWGCRNLESIILPNSVYAIGSSAFCDCKSLASIAIPDSVIDLSGTAFNGCDNLSALYGRWASSDNRCWVVDGELRAFAYAGLTSYTIPDCVTRIGESSIAGCKLTEIIIPNTVTSIGDKAFSYSTRLNSVYIPESVTKISSSAFYLCDNIENVYITNMAAWCNIDFYSGYNSGNPLRYGGKLYLNGELVTNLFISNDISGISAGSFYGCSSLVSLTIHNSVSSIGRDAFSYCCNLKSVVIGNSVMSIGNGAFYECVRLTSVTIGDRVTKIHDSAFGSCACLSHVSLGDNLNEIASFVFSGCNNLTKITLPANLTYIGSDVFKDCNVLTCVYCKALTPPTVAPNSSQGLGLNTDTVIYVDDLSLSLYKQAPKWNEFNIYKWTFNDNIQ